MKKILRFQNAISEKIESFSQLDSRIKNSDISLSEDETALTALLSFDGFSVKIVYSDYDMYRGYNFLEDNKLNGKCLNTSFVFPFSELEYSIYDVHNAVDDREFVPLEFHTINERQYADAAIDTVISFISRHIDELNNCDERIKTGLDKSFENGVKLASKRMSVDEIRADKKKLEKHMRNMYFHRYDQSYFINFICNGKTLSLQRWLAKMSAKGKLFTFEERYFEYLMDNDFTVDNEKLRARAKKNEKTALYTMVNETASIVLGLICSTVLILLCSKLSEQIFFSGYEKLVDFRMFKSFPFVIIATAFSFMFIPIVKKLFFKNKSIGLSNEKLFEGNKLLKILSVIVIIVMAVTEVFLSSKCVAVNQDNFYYCDSVGKQEYVEFSDVELFITDGWYEYDEFYEGKEYILVFDKDYDNFIELCSDDYEKLPMNKLKITGEYKTIRDFQKVYCDYE
ncbi:MAG: hypothetical protein J1E81_03575 [Eubacterium sp.]|nr:hypothetical protein [Eubacterium sp.]